MTPLWALANHPGALITMGGISAVYTVVLARRGHWVAALPFGVLSVTAIAAGLVIMMALSI